MKFQVNGYRNADQQHGLELKQGFSFPLIGSLHDLIIKIHVIRARLKVVNNENYIPCNNDVVRKNPGVK